MSAVTSTATARAPEATVGTHNKGYRGLPMEGFIATWYARNRKPDAEHHALVSELRDLLPPGARVLEVAPGPGTLAIDLARVGFLVTGLDVSRTFVAMAGETARTAGVNVDFRHGNASAMPFESGSFRFVLCRAAFKNFSQPVEALREMERVLEPGGTVLISDLRRDATLGEIEAEVATMNLSAFNAWLTRFIFRHSLLRRAYIAEEMRAMVEQTGLRVDRIDLTNVGMHVRLAKD